MCVDLLIGAINNLLLLGGFDFYGIMFDEFGCVWVVDCCGGAKVWMYVF